MKKMLGNTIILGAIIFGVAIAANAQRVLGGYKTAATDDERVVAAANFAVDKRVETNTEQEGLTLSSVDKAETQSVQGTNYRVCMTVSLDDQSQQVRAVVYQNLQGEYSLTSWEVVENCN
jgi:predicted fused transcriptional regulator/phosphomethylpyrimidine kinase